MPLLLRTTLMSASPFLSIMPQSKKKESTSSSSLIQRSTLGLCTECWSRPRYKIESDSFSTCPIFSRTLWTDPAIEWWVWEEKKDEAEDMIASSDPRRVE
ncbi:hypothetical protein RRG08_012560 [Elysia crispata]|uniref:Uncharacterized protein n=1 Tax=Elysia crispata TaxID=231223 RepID=A0AAE1AP96_9GAST|nr:hypothetical protein RRG08_012560 [Elysia crispata]